MSGPVIPAVQLTAPSVVDGAGAVRLDAAQASAVRAGAGGGPGGHLLVLGAPGTGKTTVVVETALAALEPGGGVSDRLDGAADGSDDGGGPDKAVGRSGGVVDGSGSASGGLSADQVLVLTATRRAAADLRDRFAARLPGERPAVRSPAALAYAVLRTRAAQTGHPPPVLVSGPEQDLALAELLAGHASGDGPDPGWPPHIDPATLVLSAFRAELRDLLMRAAERGIDPERLAVLGRRHRRPEWVAAARVYDEYLATWALRATTPDVGARLDPAVVVDEAVAALVTWEREVPGVPRPAWKLVLVDDYQEATVATARLLQVLAADGARIVLAGDPDAAVQTFRGGQPSLVARAQAGGSDGSHPGPGGLSPPAGRGGHRPARREPGELGASTVVLRTAWRQTPALRALTRAVTDRIGTVGVAEHRSATALSAQIASTALPRSFSQGDSPGAAHGQIDGTQELTRGHSGDTPGDGGRTRPARSQLDGPWLTEQPTSGHDGGTPAGPDPSAPQVAVLPSVAQETAYVAHRLRTAHLDRGVPWDEMAVVTRTGSRVAQLRRALGAAGVPVTVLGSDVALRDEPACRPLLDALGVVAGAVKVDLALASSLLMGPLGGLDALGLRRVRRALRAAEVTVAAAEGRTAVRSSEELLVELVASPAQVPLVPGPLDRAVERLGRVLTAGRRAVRPNQSGPVSSGDARTVLWAMWDASGLAQAWRTLALAGGPAGDRADRDLDAVLALFTAAESFADRLPLAGPAAFVDWVRAQDLPADSLAPRGATGGVAVLTPAGAAGREWAEVMVVGVQDGVWPDLRLRDSLLGAQELVDVVAGRVAAPGRGSARPTVAGQADVNQGTGQSAAVEGDSAEQTGTAQQTDRAQPVGPLGGVGVPSGAQAAAEPSGRVGAARPGVVQQATAEQVRAAQARAAVLADELRSFAVACSRARDRLLVTAVADQDTAPSVLVDLVRPPTGDGADDRLTTAPAPHDLRGLVARLRARLEAACARGETDQAAARQLARLAAAGVSGAHPAQWQGLRAPSCDSPLWRDDELVPLSPSRLDAAHRCALRWALEAAGGRSPDTGHADLGTLVHQVAAAHPTGTKAQLREALDHAWAGLGRPPGWAATSERRRAEAMMDRLAGYLAARPAPLAVEQGFSVRTGRARLYGQVDRLEMGARPGTVVVVDLKTGSTVPSVEQARHDAQLGAYQLAVDSGAFDAALSGRGAAVPGLTSAGARLLYVSSGSKATVRSQPPLADDTWARDLVDEVATTVASATFTATTNDTCRTCPVPSSCPLRSEGRQVVAG